MDRRLAELWVLVGAIALVGAMVIGPSVVSKPVVSTPSAAALTAGDVAVSDGWQFNSLLPGHEGFYSMSFPVGTVVDSVTIDFAEQGANWGETLGAAFFSTTTPSGWTSIPANTAGATAAIYDPSGGDGGHFGPPTPDNAFWTCILKEGTSQHDTCPVTSVTIEHVVQSGEKLWFEADTNTNLSPEFQITAWVQPSASAAKR